MIKNVLNIRKMNEENFKEIYETNFNYVEIEPPDGIKQKIYQRISYESNQRSFCYSSYLPQVSEKLFKLVIPVWILVYILMTIFIPTIVF